jgi:isocitrate/methylisocitrate lyase
MTTKAGSTQGSLSISTAAPTLATNGQTNGHQKSFDERVAAMREYFASPRFAGIVRLYSPRQVVEQQGTRSPDYPVAREAAEAFYARLRQLFAERRPMTTFGPYSPGQAVVIKRSGIDGIYLGGWATSAKGSITEDPGADLASYPLNTVPDEAAGIVRALLAADKNQYFARARMTPEQRAATPEIDYRPFIIADADTGHGGDAHVRNLIRRFVEVGVPGYHIEDQKPGVKKCGHQGGKVLVAEHEQVQRLNAARFQLDVMGVPGIVVARTDAEAANLIEGRDDERDQPFILGATDVTVPSYRVISLAIHRMLHQLGVDEIRGHLMFAVPDSEYAAAEAWLERAGVAGLAREQASAWRERQTSSIDAMLDTVMDRFLKEWQADAGLATYADAVADVLESRARDDEPLEMSVEQWRAFARRAPWETARARAEAMGVNILWDCEHAKTPDGYYQVKPGLDYAIAKSLAVAPFSDMLWMETATADLHEAREFAEAIHAEFPDKMLAYNLSPSFNWDTTGMSDEAMKRFPDELGKLGFTFTFVTYGGHQIDGIAAEEFAAAIKQDGMLALARLQRKIRLVESPYRTPQTLVGGPRLDAALMASSGRTATTKAMGQGSTQVQHLVQTEVPTRLLDDWLKIWTETNRVTGSLRAELRPMTAGSELLELRIFNPSKEKVANIVFADVHDRRGHKILSVRDQNTFDPAMRNKRLMTLAHLFLIHRYKSGSLHYVTPTEDNQRQTQKMKTLGIFNDVHTEIGQIIVAAVNTPRIGELVAADRVALRTLIQKD